jgi:hypothetical protein
MCIKVVWNLFINYWKINKPYNMQNLKSSLIYLSDLPSSCSWNYFKFQVLHYEHYFICMSQILKPMQFFLHPWILKLWTYFVKTWFVLLQFIKIQNFCSWKSLWIIIFFLIMPKDTLMFALSSMFCRFWFYIVTYTLFSSFKLNLSISSYYTPPL